MLDYNVVHLGGRLTSHPDLDQTSGGTSVVDMSMAVNRFFNGEEETSFFDVTVWGDQAENVAEYLSKGDPVLITGRLQQDRWQNEQGDNRSKVKVVANDVRFLSSGEGGGQQEYDDTQPASTGDDEGDEFSDIPF